MTCPNSHFSARSLSSTSKTMSYCWMLLCWLHLGIRSIFVPTIPWLATVYPKLSGENESNTRKVVYFCTSVQNFSSLFICLRVPVPPVSLPELLAVLDLFFSHLQKHQKPLHSLSIWGSTEGLRLFLFCSEPFNDNPDTYYTYTDNMKMTPLCSPIFGSLFSKYRSTSHHSFPCHGSYFLSPTS